MRLSDILNYIFPNVFIYTYIVLLPNCKVWTEKADHNCDGHLTITYLPEGHSVQKNGFCALSKSKKKEIHLITNLTQL